LKAALSPAETVYLTDANATVAYGGNDYVPFPFKISDQVEDGNGQPGEITITTANVNREMTTLIERYRGMFGVVVTLYRMYGSTLVLSDSFKIQSSSVNDTSATFRAGNQDLFAVQVPSERFLRSRCRFRYKDPDTCGYAGALAECDRTLWGTNGCMAHGNQANYGGTPGIPRR
jgi:phage-related protein